MPTPETTPGPDREWMSLLVQGGYLLDENGDLAHGKSLNDARLMLAKLLDYKHPGWRESEAFIARIKEVGVVPALSKMIVAGLS